MAFEEGHQPSSRKCLFVYLLAGLEHSGKNKQKRTWDRKSTRRMWLGNEACVQLGDCDIQLVIFCIVHCVTAEKGHQQ